MSRCKLRTPSPIHFKLRTVIGIDSLYWPLDYLDLFAIYVYSWFFLSIFSKGMSKYYSVLFQHKYCINVPIHVYGAAVGEI
jgi:hypothetical protein